MNWADYVPYDPGLVGPLHTHPKKEARAAFDRLMAAKAERIEALRRLLAANGLALDPSDAGIQRLQDWMRAEVRPDPRDPNRLQPMWYSVVNDAALFLGDVIISRAPGLRWKFFEGKKNTATHRHVLMGFNVPNPNFNVDIDFLVAGDLHRVLRGLPVRPDEFTAAVHASVEHAGPKAAARA